MCPNNRGKEKEGKQKKESHPTCDRAEPVPVCTRLLGAFAPFAVRQRDLSRDGSLSERLRVPQRIMELVSYKQLMKKVHNKDLSNEANCPVTCCLDPFFHLKNFFSIYYPFFHIVGPACHCGRSRLSLSSTFPTSFSLHSVGPACHCGRSPFSLSYRPLSLSSTSPTPISPYPIGPACHCGRSRLFPSPPSPHLLPFFFIF